MLQAEVHDFSQMIFLGRKLLYESECVNVCAFEDSDDTSEWRIFGQTLFYFLFRSLLSLALSEERGGPFQEVKRFNVVDYFILSRNYGLIVPGIIVNKQSEILKKWSVQFVAILSFSICLCQV